MIWFILTPSAIAQPSSVVGEPFTLEFTHTSPVALSDDGQGKHTWDFVSTSDGKAAWLVATVASPPPLYRAPGSPGYRSSDYMWHRPDHLIAWRQTAFVERVDLSTGTIRFCSWWTVLEVLPTGSAKVIHEPEADKEIGGLGDDGLWVWLWHALGADPGMAVNAKATRSGTVTGTILSRVGKIRGKRFVVDKYEKSYSLSVQKRVDLELKRCELAAGDD